MSEPVVVRQLDQLRFAIMASAAHEKKVQGMIAKLPGKTLAERVRIVRTSPCGTDTERAAWLKKEHGLGHFQARLVVGEAKKQRGAHSP
jgi:hypothetical protein